MKKVLLLSPHFDDAILSVGQFMAGRPDTEVVTIFGGMPQDKQMLTDYDKKCGFESAEQALNIRRDEDNLATALLRATAIHWDYPDSQYGEELDIKRLKDDLLSQMNQDYEMVIAPLGIGHPDHKLISDIVVSLLTSLSKPVYFWEDLPIRVIEPELVNARIAKMPGLRLQFLGDGPMADKIRALSCYKSQIGTGILNPFVMYVPERFWRAK